MKKIVLIGDIVASKKIKNRAEVQKKLVRLFKNINENNKTLDSPFTITLGDEFQALYNKADNIFKDIWQIMYVLYPERVRFSIGVGELNTKVNKKQAIGMDGPAFYNARSGLDELKEYSFLFNISGEDIENIDFTRQVLFLVSRVITKWKTSRMKIFDSLYQGNTVKTIARKLKISDKAVYKNIDTGGMYMVMALFEEISNLLNKAIKKG